MALEIVRDIMVDNLSPTARFLLIHRKDVFLTQKVVHHNAHAL